IYTSQLQALENYVNLHPRQADARFLLAYHYMTAGHTDAAKEQLERIVALVPSDQLAANLLRMVGGGAATPPAVPSPPAPGPDVAPLDPAALVGDWHANRDDGASFELNLAPDKTFTWTFEQNNQQQTITGAYTLDKSVLILQGKNQGAMVAQVSAAGGNRFSFKPLGGPPDDPGLTFVR
ncbi:MAG: tetratricopeptide repeat protein, partial [Pirellulales bacterium]